MYESNGILGITVLFVTYKTMFILHFTGYGISHNLASTVLEC